MRKHGSLGVSVCDTQYLHYFLIAHKHGWTRRSMTPSEVATVSGGGSLGDDVVLVHS